MTSLLFLLSLASPHCQAALPAADVRVVDGDTLEATVLLPMRTLRREVFRLARINAPEMNTTAGKLAKIALVEKLKGQDVSIGAAGTEKYGRWLGEVCLGEESVNDWLVAMEYAKEYSP